MHCYCNYQSCHIFHHYTPESSRQYNLPLATMLTGSALYIPYPSEFLMEFHSPDPDQPLLYQTLLFPDYIPQSIPLQFLKDFRSAVHSQG